MDWVFTGDRAQLNTRNVNVAFNPADRSAVPLVGGTAAANYINRPYPGWGTVQMNRSDGKQNYNALHDGVHQAHVESLAGFGELHVFPSTSVFDQLPLNPGCQYP